MGTGIGLSIVGVIAIVAIVVILAALLFGSKNGRVRPRTHERGRSVGSRGGMGMMIIILLVVIIIILLLLAVTMSSRSNLYL